MFSSFSAKKELPLSGCNIWLAPDLSNSKNEYKTLIECNGGKFCSRLSSKVNFAVTSKATSELADKAHKHSITIVLDSFLRECIKTCTPLFPFTNPKHTELQKENYPNYLSYSFSSSPGSAVPVSSSPTTQFQSSTQTLPTSIATPTTSNPALTPTPTHPSYSSYNAFEFESSSPQRSRGLRERLKSLSLKTKHKVKKATSSSAPSSPSPSRTISKAPPPSSSQRTKMRNASRALCDSLAEGEDNINGNSSNNTNNNEDLLLHNLVFVIYGNFSIPREVMESLIVTNGGRFVPYVTEEVTHILFGGEAMEATEFEKAIKQHVHIVNEYFLRLMIKY